VYKFLSPDTSALSRFLCKVGIYATLITMLMMNTAYSQKYQPTPENLKNREWFQDAKFGLFIHWGVYSVLGDGEWVMNQQQIPIHVYEKIPSFLIPPILMQRRGYKWRRTPA
jgi:alpha-L-fucosidase